MANPFVHVELATTDLDKAKSFYTSLFNWQVQEPEAQRPQSEADAASQIGFKSFFSFDMTSFTLPSQFFPLINVGGGMMKHPVPGAQSSWLPYAQVDDITAATAKAKSLGAAVMRDVAEVPNAGSFSIIIDPTGAALGLWHQRRGDRQLPLGHSDGIRCRLSVEKISPQRHREHGEKTIISSVSL